VRAGRRSRSYAQTIANLCLSVFGCVIWSCVSPEASRVRGGGPGADLGNRSGNVRLHGGAKMYYHTPCRTEKVKCSGPMPVFGTAGT